MVAQNFYQFIKALISNVKKEREDICTNTYTLLLRKGERKRDQNGYQYI